MAQFTLKPGGWPRPFAGMLQNGDRLGDRYRIIKPTAAGGMGRIYQGKDEDEGRLVAIKVLSVPVVDDIIIERFEREARLLRSISSHNVVRAYESGRTDKGELYLVLEWLDGSDLSEVLKAERTLEIDHAFAVALGALRGLHAIHREGVLHRDVKPGNIFVTQEEPPPEGVKLLDFGVAKVFEEDAAEAATPNLTVTGMVVGTPFYMAPEQAQGRDKIDHRADLFALGAVLYELISGRRPYEGSSALTLLVRIASEPPRPIREIDPSLPASLDRFFEKALARKPEDRFQSAIEMEEALESLTGQTVEMPIPFSGLDATGPFEVTEKLTEEVSAQSLRDAIDGPTQKLAPSLDARPSIADISGPLPTLRSVIGETEPPGARELRMVTVVVADLSAVGAQRRLAWAVFQRSVQQEGGEALPVRGGLAIGVFGAKKSKGDEPTRALQAGLRTLGLDVHATNEIGVVRDLRVAVGTGTVVRAPGASLRGEAIEAACDLLTFAEPGELITDADTLGQTKTSVQTKPRGRNAFVVVAGGAGTLAHSEQVGRTAPFVGREAELEMLTDAFNEVVRTGRPGGVLITGRAGVGKTRLREEFRKHLVRNAVRTNVVIGQADHSTQATPLAVFADAMRRRGAILGTEEVATLVAKISRLVPRSIGPTVRDQAMSGIARLVGAQLPDAYAPTQPDPSSEHVARAHTGRRARSAVLEVLRGYSDDGPVALILEDTQWSDDASLSVLLELLTDETSRPLFVLMLCRSDPSEEVRTKLDAFVELELMRPLELSQLSKRNTEIFASALLGAEVTPELLELLFARTGGNPYFLEETIRVLLHGPDPSEQQATRLKERLDSVPTNVHAVIQARLDEVGTDEREVLKRASVIGTTFWEASLEALGVEEPMELLDRLIARELIDARATSRFPEVREFSFRSSLLRDVTYSLIPENEKRRFHRRTADWLGEMGEADPLLLAGHLVPGGEHARAAVALLEGARQALAMGSADDATKLAEQGLDVAENHELATTRADLLIVQQKACELLGDYQKALGCLSQIEKLPRAAELSGWLMLRRARMTLLRGNANRALAMFRSAGEVFEKEMRPLDVGRAAIGLGHALRDRGDIMPACEEYQRAYTIARQHGELRLVATSLLHLGRMAYATADLGQALRLISEAEGTFSNFSEDIQAQGESLLMHGAAWLMSGDHEQALTFLERARQKLLTTPDPMRVRLAWAYEGVARFELGAHDEAFEILRETYENAGASESKHDLFSSGTFLVRALLDAERNSEALDLAQTLRDQAVRSLSRFVVPLESALGLAKARAGDTDDGLRYTISALHRLESKKACEDEDPQRIYANHAEALALAGLEESQVQWQRAKTTLDEVASRLAQDHRAPYLKRPLNARIAQHT